MALFFRLGLAGLLLLLTVLPASAETLYNQPPFSEKELSQFIADLPRFRAWIKTNKEKARRRCRHHPARGRHHKGAPR